MSLRIPLQCLCCSDPSFVGLIPSIPFRLDAGVKVLRFVSYCLRPAIAGAVSAEPEVGNEWVRGDLGTRIARGVRAAADETIPHHSGRLHSGFKTPPRGWTNVIAS